jgi:hypothetical protein
MQAEIKQKKITRLFCVSTPPARRHTLRRLPARAKKLLMLYFLLVEAPECKRKYHPISATLGPQASKTLRVQVCHDVLRVAAQQRIERLQARVRVRHGARRDCIPATGGDAAGCKVQGAARVRNPHAMCLPR